MKLDKSLVMPAAWAAVALAVLVLVVAFSPDKPAAPTIDMGQPSQGASQGQ